MMRGKTFFEKKVFPRAPYPKNFMREGMDYVCGGLGVQGERMVEEVLPL